MKHLYFDESGFTGNNLLDSSQPFFCYVGVESDSATEFFFIKLKEKYGYSENEVKGLKLCKHSSGQKLLKDLWSHCSDKTKYVLHDKKYALAAKIFEYVYEPVFAKYNTIIYNSGLHIFFSNFLYSDFFLRTPDNAEKIFVSFQNFIKERKSFCFSDTLVRNDNACIFLDFFVNFCRKFSANIASDINFEEKTDSWILDLTSTSLFNLLGAFEADSTETLKVICDKSKPLDAFSPFFNSEIGNDKIVYAGLRNGEKHRLTFNLAEKIHLEDSKDYKSLQIADFLASSVIYSANNPNDIFSKDIMSLSQNSFVASTSLLPINMLDSYTDIEIWAYLEMLRILAMSYSKKEKMLKVAYLTNFIRKEHKFDLLRYLK